MNKRVLDWLSAMSLGCYKYAYEFECKTNIAISLFGNLSGIGVDDNNE